MRRAALALLFSAALAAAQAPKAGGELRFCLRAEPKTFDPLLVQDESSETIRYLTGGVLVRIDRLTQELTPQLAVSWKLQAGGRQAVFQLRPGVSFSDGTPFSAADIVFTIRALVDPKVNAPGGEPFRAAGEPIEAMALAADRVRIGFPKPLPGLLRLLDQVPIVSSRSAKRDAPVLGPFQVAEYKPGVHVLLKRNPRYWNKPLPYLDGIRLDIQQNRELELLRFRRGEIHLINSLDPELFDRLVAEMPGAARDAGASLDSEQIWFNQAPPAPLEENKKAWFRSRSFRRGISAAINRADLCRVVYRGHAMPAAGPVSPADHFWFHPGLKAEPCDSKTALQRLAEDGFRLTGDVLRDRGGRAVEFSLITNSGNRNRERIAAMIQQDLKRIGIKVNVVTLDFPSLLERITRSFDYEACLLGLVNVEADPNSQMNVWLSSAANHQWNPNQKSPATPWEAELDKLMRAQASTADDHKRQALFHRVQEIVADQVPFIYLVNRNALAAVSPRLGNSAVAPLRPQTYWNVERLYLEGTH